MNRLAIRYWIKTGRISVSGFLQPKMRLREKTTAVKLTVPERLFPSYSVMIESSITFLDSGIGGLPYLDWVKARHPGLPLTYLADSANFPYGDMSPDALTEVVLKSVRRLLSFGTPRLLVIACNTASVTALDEIRAISPCPVVGTVPAVKPAAGLKGTDPIGVMATAGTVNSPYLDRLVASFAAHRKVIRVAAGDIVRFVEEQWLDSGDEGAVPVMQRAVDTLKKSRVGSIVLGCTHFLHLLTPIREMVGENIPLFDSRDGVGRRILSLLDENYLNSEEKNAVSSFFVTKSGDRDTGYRRFSSLHGLEWAGELC